MTRAARGSPKSAKCRKGASASRARPSAATRITFAEKNAKKRKKGKAETACFLLLFASSFVFCGPLLLSLFRSFLPEEQDVGPLRCRAGPATILERTRRAQSRSCETKPILRFRIADCGLRIADCGLRIGGTVAARANCAKRTQFAGVNCAKRTQFAPSVREWMRMAGAGRLRRGAIVRNKAKLGEDGTSGGRHIRKGPMVQNEPNSGGSGRSRVSIAQNKANLPPSDVKGKYSAEEEL
jgi:hypothetical protein